MTRNLCFFGFITLLSLSFGLADLRSDLKEFRALVPRRRIAFIAARYYIFDAQFRQALEFIRSPQFTATWQEIRATPEFVEIVDYVTAYGAGYDITSAIDKIPNRLSKFEISRTVPVSMMLQRNLTTFLREVLQSLPRAKMSSLFERKVNEDGDFAKLYKALRDSKFQQLITKARKARNLMMPIAKLHAQNINVDEIIQLFFEVLSWGPKV